MFTDSLKLIRGNRLSCHAMRKLQRFPQQFRSSKSAAVQGNL
jgi:hypothetical protein